jgi:uracil-DNA glycosylase family 4
LSALCKGIGVARSRCRIENVVRCRPPQNRDPKPAEIQACLPYLVEAVERAEALIVVPLGKVSTGIFLGPVSMEQVHGIPFEVEWMGQHLRVVPAYHPAAALHRPDLMLAVQEDFRTVSAVLRGEQDCRHIEDPFEGIEEYTLAVGSSNLGLIRGLPVAIDTESLADGTPWCLSASQNPGTGVVVRADNTEGLAEVRGICQESVVVLHNALYDLPVLSKMGIEIPVFEDTMVMAYLLQSEPQGLKPLAYRHCGMAMQDYSDIVHPYTIAKATEYLLRVLGREWPDPDLTITWEEGIPKSHKPQNIGRKVRRIIDAIADGADPYERWRHIEQGAGRGMVEAELGPLLPADVSDLPLDRAISYAARDADATLRLWPLLRGRLEALDLLPTFETDMGVIPMVVDMIETGLLIDPAKFHTLAAYFEGKLTELLDTLEIFAGKRINPASPLQVKEFIYNDLGLR